MLIYRVSDEESCLMLMADPPVLTTKLPNSLWTCALYMNVETCPEAANEKRSVPAQGF